MSDKNLKHDERVALLEEIQRSFSELSSHRRLLIQWIIDYYDSWMMICGLQDLPLKQCAPISEELKKAGLDELLMVITFKEIYLKGQQEECPPDA